MIKLGTKEVVARYYGNKVISAVYRGSVLVWQSIRSCFGGGLWAEQKPWIETESWKEN